MPKHTQFVYIYYMQNKSFIKMTLAKLVKVTKKNV